MNDTEMTARDHLNAARAFAQALRDEFAHLRDRHGCAVGLIGPMTFDELIAHHDSIPGEWVAGSNIPGSLPDNAPDGPACWREAAQLLMSDLRHEAELIDDEPDGDINDSDALREAADEVENHQYDEGIELVLRDSTGRDRAFWIRRSE